MSIRIRWTGARPKAICAAETEPEPGDLYLDDAIHDALTEKFMADWTRNGIILAEQEAEELVSEVWCFGGWIDGVSLKHPPVLRTKDASPCPSCGGLVRAVVGSEDKG